MAVENTEIQNFSSTFKMLAGLNNNSSDLNDPNNYSSENISSLKQSTTDAYDQSQAPDQQPEQQYNAAQSQISQYQQTYNAIFGNATSPNPGSNNQQQMGDLHNQVNQFLNQNQNDLSQQDTDSKENNLDQFGNSTQPSLLDSLKTLSNKTSPDTFQSDVQQNQLQSTATPSPSAEQSNAPSFKPGSGGFPG